MASPKQRRARSLEARGLPPAPISAKQGTTYERILAAIPVMHAAIREASVASEASEVAEPTPGPSKEQRRRSAGGMPHRALAKSGFKSYAGSTASVSTAAANEPGAAEVTMPGPDFSLDFTGAQEIEEECRKLQLKLNRLLQQNEPVQTRDLSTLSRQLEQTTQSTALGSQLQQNYFLLRDAELQQKGQERPEESYLKKAELVNALAQESDMPRAALEKCTVQRLRLLLRDAREEGKTAKATPAPAREPAPELSPAASSPSAAAATPRAVAPVANPIAPEVLKKRSLEKELTENSGQNAARGLALQQEEPPRSPRALGSLHGLFAKTKANWAHQGQQDEQVGFAAQSISPRADDDLASKVPTASRCRSPKEIEHAEWHRAAEKFPKRATSAPIGRSQRSPVAARMRKIDFYFNAKERTQEILDSPSRGRSPTTRREKDTAAPKKHVSPNDDVHMDLLDYTLGG